MKILATLLFLGLLCSAGCSPSEKPSPKGDAHYMYGLSYLRQQQHTQALREFLLAVEADPERADFQNVLSSVVLQKRLRLGSRCGFGSISRKKV